MNHIKFFIQRTYGASKNCLHTAVDYGMIPEELKDYRQEQFVIFDLESGERESDLETKMEVNGVHKVISIGASSSLPVDDKYFARKSSAPEHSTELVSSFLDWLFDVEKVYRTTVPEEILDAFPDEDDEYTSDVCDKVRAERELRKYAAMPVYGYNSGKSIQYGPYQMGSYHMTHIFI